MASKVTDISWGAAAVELASEDWAFPTDAHSASPFGSADELALYEHREHMDEQPHVTRLAPFFDDEMLPFDEAAQLET